MNKEHELSRPVEEHTVPPDMAGSVIRPPGAWASIS